MKRQNHSLKIKRHSSFRFLRRMTKVRNQGFVELTNHRLHDTGFPSCCHQWK